MKRARILIFVIGILILGTLWVIEPLSYNPFAKVKIPVAIGESSMVCKEVNSVGASKLEEKGKQLINTEVEAGHFLGVTAGMYKDSCGTFVSGAGFMDKSDHKRVSADMVGRIASVTKPMTAIAIMQLYEIGKLDLDVPVQTYLTDFPKKAKGDISIRQLLKHTSGFPHYASKWEAVSFSHYSNLENALEAIQDKELVFTPGTEYLYSSYGYTILGAIIEKISGVTYEEYMKEYIWEKAGMLDTALETKGENYEHKSQLYLKIGSTFIKSPKSDLSIIYPAGGVQSTTKDLLKFGQAILNDQLIKRSTLEMMINATDELSVAKGDDPYGFGWAVYKHPKYGTIIQHSGAQPGTSSFFSIYMDQRVVTAVLSNSFGTKQSTYELSNNLASLVLEK